jgi:hypothetical protein
MLNRKLACLSLTTLAVSISTTMASAALIINDGAFTYSQNFNSLPNDDTGALAWTDNSTLVGWYRRANVSNATQTLDPDLVDVSAKGANVGPPAFYNASTAGNTDRAVGFRINGQPDGLKKGSVGVIFSNNTGQTITGFDLGYTGEQWYKATNATTLLVQYRIVNSFTDINGGDIDFAEGGAWSDISALDWSVAANGSNGWSNGTTNSTTFAPETISGLTWNDGQQLVLRWRIAETGVQQNGLFIDDVSLGNLALIPEPSSLALLGLGGLLIARRRRA